MDLLKSLTFVAVMLGIAFVAASLLREERPPVFLNLSLETH